MLPDGRRFMSDVPTRTHLIDEPIEETIEGFTPGQCQVCSRPAESKFNHEKSCMFRVGGLPIPVAKPGRPINWFALR
jgi:hypothetical protein